MDTVWQAYVSHRTRSIHLPNMQCKQTVVQLSRLVLHAPYPTVHTFHRVKNDTARSQQTSRVVTLETSKLLNLKEQSKMSHRFRH